MADGKYRRLRPLCEGALRLNVGRRVLACSVQGCDAEHHGHGYCIRHWRQVQRGGLKDTGARPCAHCQGTFQPSKAGVIYCCAQCKVQAWRKANPNATCLQPTPNTVCAIYAGYCQACKKAFVARRKRRCCTDSCERKVAHRRTYVSLQASHRNCRRCGAWYEAPKGKTFPEVFCGAACKAAQKRDTRAASKQKRKLALRAIHVESVQPQRVFERDGWRCYLCGCETPKALRGTYEPNAPELEHVIPVSKSGAHTYANTRCACRACNQAKGDTIGWRPAHTAAHRNAAPVAA